MATLTKGILGTLSGKVGNLVFVSRNGKCYVKSRPRPSKKEPSEKQLIQRKKFGMVTRFLSPVKSLINETYTGNHKGPTPLNLAIKQILTEAIGGEDSNPQIDYSKVTLIKGSLASACNIAIHAAGPHQLILSWRAQNTMLANPDDQLMVLLYCESLGEFWYGSDLQVGRSDEYCSIDIPASFLAKEVQVWLAYRSADGRAYSNSTYAGVVNGKSHKRS